MWGHARKAAAVAQVLRRAGKPLSGLEIVKACGGAVSRGTVYPTLKRMSERGLIVTVLQPRKRGDSGPRRALYRIA